MDSRGNLLVTASTDETMRIYNLKTRCDSGLLTKHQGSVTYVCLSWNSKYLISCGEDKVVCIWRCSNWDPVKSFDDIHDCTPISADFHPSMKLALTLDIEGNICIINLMQGSLAAKFTVPGLDKKDRFSNRRYGLFTLIKFNMLGSYYAVLSQRELVVSNITDEEDWYLSYSTTDLGLGPVQITSFCWINNQIFLVGFSNGQLRMFKITRQKLINLEITFTVSKTTSEKIKNPHLGNRIKGICTIGYNHLKDESFDDFKTCGKLVTCDSSGIFVLFNFRLGLNQEIGNIYCELEIMDVLDSDNRITCMAIEDRNPIDPLSLTHQDNPDSTDDKNCLHTAPAKGNKKLKVIKKGRLNDSKKKDNLKH
ncbi:WD repeat [Cryptosporidium sp. chipmunk genotype I]|uniref:WD repeat n=1 Tax=Cryptosporidium sp. chipmunk genotype I TaxID=1280935 RepID=UPI00351A9962|nr:WD repeat [Cryptosporidium sp. chipmunk genotype I]